MTDLKMILNESFLEFLQEKIAKLCNGKISVVFEDLNAKPITTKLPRERVFAPRDEGNVCKQMIDNPANKNAQLKCWLSDAQGATMANMLKKGYLYRCHQGKGFPNFLFPIVIWPDEVVGYLYVGQFVFKEFSKEEEKEFLERLKAFGYQVGDPERFISGWTETELKEFYNYIIDSPALRKQKDFSYDRFKELILNQKKHYGLSMDEFFDIIEFIQGLANELSALGNALYILKTIVEIESYLSPFLSAKYESVISELQNVAMMACGRASGQKEELQNIVNAMKEKEIDVLMDVKAYEDQYLEKLIEPYIFGILKSDEVMKSNILEFYARNIVLEAIVYCKIRDKFGNRDIIQKKIQEGDALLETLFDSLSSCGQLFKAVTETIRELFLKMYFTKEVSVLLNNKFSSCLTPLFEDEDALKKWLLDHGITGITLEARKKRVSFTRTFDVMVEEMKSLLINLKNLNKNLCNLLKTKETKFVDLGELALYVKFVNSLRRHMSKIVSEDKCRTRQSIYLKANKIFLNSGGLTPTHRDSLKEQQKWILYRSEEGPIGLTVEGELEERVELARRLVKDLINAESNDCVLFTHNTTSSIDMVLRSILKPGDEVLTSDAEHDVVYCLAEYYQKHLGCNFRIVKIAENLLNGEDWISKFIDEISPSTRLILLSHITFCTGSLLPIKEVIKRVNEESKRLGQKIFVLIDGAHAVGNIKVDVQELGCDFYAFDGHKWLLGPEGTGMLYCKEEYIKEGDAYGVHMPVATAFTTSPNCSPKKNNNQNYELGTMNASNIIALGQAIKAFLELDIQECMKWRRYLTEKFAENIKNSRWKIININDARDTGILCLQIDGCAKEETYQKIVKILDGRNVTVRYISKPPCIRVCINHFNNETDIKIAAFHLKALLEGANRHIGNHEKISIKIKEEIQSFMAQTRQSGLDGCMGLSLFSVPGAGKSYLVEKILKELKKEKAIKEFFIIRGRDVLKEDRPEKVFSQIIYNAQQSAPSIIFIDEADKLLNENQKSILGIFNEECSNIERKRSRIVFITAENDPYFPENARRRLKLAYFPLPDFETRLKYLQDLVKCVQCSSDILLTQIARYTEGFSMDELKKLCGMAIRRAGDSILKPEHFQESFELLQRTVSENLLRKYDRMIDDLKPMLFTGEIEL
jgi:L-cysteine/cystine lyase